LNNLLYIFPAMPGLITMTECNHDHTDGRNLVSDEEIDADHWPVIYDDSPKAGVKQIVKCAECGERVEVFYRAEMIADKDGVLWERD
jgi:hypothetical protein